jgi:hypothetical protein
MFRSVSLRQTIGLLGVLAFCESATAEFVTSTEAFQNAKVVTFDDFTGFNTIASGGMQVGDEVGEDIWLTSANENSKIGTVPTGDLGFGGNGKWDSGAGSIVSMGSYNPLTFAFNDGPVSAVGGFVNYNPERSNSLKIVAYDNEGVEIERWDVSEAGPISTPDETNAADFRGIVFDEDKIYSFALIGGQAATKDLWFVRADGIQAVPEPSSVALCGAAAGFAAILRLRRRRSKRGATPEDLRDTQPV